MDTFGTTHLQGSMDIDGFLKGNCKGHYRGLYCSTDFGGMFQPDNPDDEVTSVMYGFPEKCGNP